MSEEHSGWYAQKLVRQADTTVSEKELWDQGVQVTLLIHLCKGVHSLMPDLGRFLVDGGLATASLWIPPEV